MAASKPLVGPDKYHLHLVGASADANIKKEIQTKLSQRGRYFYYEDSPTQEGEGMKVSRKVAILLSAAFKVSDEYDLTLELALRRREVRGNGSVIVLLLQLSEGDIPSSLKDLEHLTYTGSDECIHSLRDMVDKDAPLALDSFPGGRPRSGAALAWSYYSGYLKIVAPTVSRKITRCGYMKRRHDQRNMPLKLLTILPTSCSAETDLCKIDADFQHMGWIYTYADRAGNVHRCYKQPIYKIHDNGSTTGGSKSTGKDYYAAIEFATPLLALYEMKEDPLCGLSKEMMHEEMQSFYFTLSAILAHPNHNQAANVKLLYHQDVGDQQSFRDFVLEHIKSEIENEVALEEETGVEDELWRMDSLDVTDGGSMTRVYQPEDENPVITEAAAALTMETYSMSPNHRDGKLGYAVIICNARFSALKERRGADKDKAILKGLFEELGYNVELEENLTAAGIRQVLEKIRVRDHSDYCSLVCCVLSHGQLGYILGTDEVPVPILDMTDNFSDKNCPSLKGKLRHFYIQACQGIPVSTEAGICVPQTEIAVVPDEPQPTVETDANPVDETVARSHIPLYGSGDFLMSYSTIPGGISYRDIYQGSFYVRNLATVFRECRGWEIDLMLKKVSNDVCKETTERFNIELNEPSSDVRKPQKPFHCQTTGKLFKFRGISVVDPRGET